MTGLMCIGECMLELGRTEGSSFRSSYAGDTYNAAVYAKRVANSLQTFFYTALGCDAISEAMLKAWHEEGIDCSRVLRAPDRKPGLYIVSTDHDGERQFSYWRKNSAATQMIRLSTLRADDIAIPYCDYIYFSGISLAILSDHDRKILLEDLARLRARGAKIAFDPNYRESLWEDAGRAEYWTHRAYQITDIAFPGSEDHQHLFNQHSPDEIRQFLQGFGVEEVVLKCGDLGVFVTTTSDTLFQPFTAVELQLDSTAAGDSFAGTYLARRIMGDDLKAALVCASAVAGLVVQHPGAIVDKALFEAFVKESRLFNE